MRTELKLGVLLLLVILLVPLGLWLYQFHGLDISSKPEDWSIFSTYIGGILGIVLAALNLGVVIYVATIARDIQKREENSVRQYETITEMHKEWNGESMYNSRDTAFTFLLNNPGVDLEKLGESKNRPSDLAHVWIVGGFFERLQALIENNMVPGKIAIDLFGQIFVWWDVFCFRDGFSDKWSVTGRITKLRAFIYANVDESTLEEWEGDPERYLSSAARPRAARGPMAGAIALLLGYLGHKLLGASLVYRRHDLGR